MPSAESVLIPLGLTAAASATDAAIYQKIYGSNRTALIISNEEIQNIRMKIVKSLPKRISGTINNEVKEQKGRFLPMLLGTLAASLLGSALTGRVVIRAGHKF